MATSQINEEQDASFDQFTQAQFDPVQFLNDTLPSLNLSSQGSAVKQTRTASLQSASTDVQSILSKLNTHSVRSSSELTTLTDGILRSGNRLAYEVEVLRGDVNSLYEILTDTLKDDISRFITEEFSRDPTASKDETTEDGVAVVAPSYSLDSSRDPDFILQLRELGTVKSRLEAVIHAFGEALKWPIPPSEVSMASSLISVSAPELGVVSTPEDDKAHEYTRKLRSEVTETLEREGGGVAGLEAATSKVNALRALLQVWKGTAEEKARTRVVDSLAKLVEERRKVLDARSATSRPGTNVTPQSSSMPGRAGRFVEGSTNTAAGLFRNLQKLRDEIYLD